METDNHLKIEDVYELSPLQQGMLLHTLLEPGSGIFVEHFSLRITSSFRPDVFEGAWRRILNRHPALRTSFHWEELDKPLQVVHREIDLPFRYYDWRGENAVALERRIAEFNAADRRQGFDLTTAPLIRIALIQMDEGQWHYIWTFHHLLLDGWSAQIINKELGTTYEALLHNREPLLPSCRPYVDYIAWLQQQDRLKARAYWQGTLAGFDASTPLPLARKLTNVTRGRYGNATLHWPKSFTEQIREFSRRQHITLSTLFQGAWAILLSRVTGRQDVVFGALVSGRPPSLPGVESIVGLFINTLPVRASVEPEEPAAAFLAGLQSRHARALEFEYAPMLDILSSTDLPQGASLFETLLVFENLPERAAHDEEGTTQSPIGFQQSNYSLNVLVGAEPAVWLKFLYDAERFDEGTVERLASHLRTIVQAIVTNPERCLGDVPLMTESERSRVLVEWNATSRPYDWDSSLVHLFTEQVNQRPDAPAFLSGSTALSYSDLNRRVNRLARRLRVEGVGPEVLVGVFLERSIEAAIALLAIFKAGGAYLALDPSYPRERLGQMLAQAPVRVLLTSASAASSIDGGSAKIVNVDDGLPDVDDDSEIMEAGEAGHLAYVIFTSGSTGHPKGVAVEHRQLLNRLFWMWERYPFAPGEVGCQKTALSFVDSLWELLGPLLKGVPTVILPTEVVRDPRALVRELSERRVTRMWLVPSLLQALLHAHEDLGAQLPQLRFWVTSGEPLTLDIARRFVEALPHAKLYNLYGTSEVWDATWHDPGSSREPADLIPIGLPISNVRTYILDERLRPVPPGVSGELYVSGAGLGRGYLGEPELTAQKFVFDPFGSGPNPRMYRTGDMVRYRDDGVIEFLGRSDRLIKLRGIRIDPAEIESVLSSHADVRQAIVSCFGGDGNSWLSAFIVPAGKEYPNLDELWRLAENQLPEYMVPAAITVLDEIPLTPSGKLNLDALTPPERRDLTAPSDPPQTSTEETLARIWAELLSLRSIRRQDSFFRLGGHSLLATRLTSRILREFGFQVPVRLIFDEPTLAGMATAIDTISWAAQMQRSAGTDAAIAEYTEL